MGCKYVIYGAGKRGKQVLDLMGKENVLAFIDKDKNKVGKLYHGILVIDIDMIHLMPQNYVCIITPNNQAMEIGLELKSKGVSYCLYYRNDIDRIFVEKKELILDKIMMLKDCKKIAIHKICITALFLYDYLKKINCNPLLVPINDDLELVDFLKSNYTISNCDEEIESYDAAIYMEECVDRKLVSKIGEKKRLYSIKELFEDSFESNLDVLKYKNIHAGEKCFIVATGPSLRIEDLELLKENNEICISMNRIYNIFDKVDWRPHYYMIQDLKMIEDLKERIATLNLPVKFVSAESTEYWKQKECINSIKYNFVSLIQMGSLPFFSTRVDRCIYEGMTVTYGCIQMAVYMGFKEIYLLGVDHNYSNDLYAGSNHFAGYDTDKKIRLNTVHIEQNELAYISAKKYADEHGIKIYNATRGGKLEVFERVDFDSLFKQS